jgi:Flp pilus assembly protein TadD
MSKSIAFKFAASALVIGTALTGCKQAGMERPVSWAAKASKGEERASVLFDQAHAEIQKGDAAKALGLAERAVEFSPHDAAYRLLLGDLYLRNGRFLSAETTYADVLELHPGHPRAMLHLALSQIALGKPYAALAQLDRLAQTAPAADLGLAYALAGQVDRAVDMLETAARAPGADGRTRQNLALAYAMAGDWQKARITAAQDVSPADLDQRLAQWASFAQPSSRTAQVASLLGVTPVADPGQPVRLALSPIAPETPVLAAAAPEPVYEAPAVSAVQYADLAPSVTQGALPVQQEAVLEDTRPAAAYVADTAPAPVPAAPAANREAVQPRNGAGRFVVQIGAYGSSALAQQGWSQAQKRFGLSAEQPLSMVVTLPGKGTFHRVSVGGFNSQADAARLCGSIKAKGGACFVRPVSTDRPMDGNGERFASRG